MSEPFIAEVRIFAGNFAPRGWAFCEGQLLPIAQNTALFSLIGTTYGGDGRTTTALPDLQGRAPMHPGRGPGLNNRRLGERGGVNQVTLSTNEIPNHSHAIRATDTSANTGDPSGNAFANTEPVKHYGPLTDPEYMAGPVIGPGGARQPHNNMQPYLTLSFIIALVGLYPSRS
ncbi:MAG TPA: tail fiber protein [Gammaproteobacteria bacterium]|nr:tail fiber protein [Gammaproteobacteria bacterium]